MDNKLCLYMMIGLPASGKTTCANNIVKTLSGEGRQIVRVSNDSIGKLMTGHNFCKNAGGFILASTELFVRYILSQGVNVVLDNTSLTVFSRSKWFDIAREYNADVIGYFLNLSLDVCIERNKTRKESVPEEVIREMFDKMEIPDNDSECFELLRVENR